MENFLIRSFSIYLVGILGIWKAIPVGIFLKAHPVETASFTALGSITTVLALNYFGEKVKSWVLKKWSKEKLESKKGRFTGILERYGKLGLGIICPGLFGPITTIIVGLFVIRKTSTLMPYLIIGIILWSFALTWVGVSGIKILGNVLNF